MAETIRCDSTCHDIHDDNCPECGSGDWSRMCDDCRYYAAQDGPEELEDDGQVIRCRARQPLELPIAEVESLTLFGGESS